MRFVHKWTILIMYIFEPLFSFTPDLQVSAKQNDLRSNTSCPYANRPQVQFLYKTIQPRVHLYETTFGPTNSLFKTTFGPIRTHQPASGPFQTYQAYQTASGPFSLYSYPCVFHIHDHDPFHSNGLWPITVFKHIQWHIQTAFCPSLHLCLTAFGPIVHIRRPLAQSFMSDGLWPNHSCPTALGPIQIYQTYQRQTANGLRPNSDIPNVSNDLIQN